MNFDFEGNLTVQEIREARKVFNTRAIFIRVFSSVIVLFIVGEAAVALIDHNIAIGLLFVCSLLLVFRNKSRLRKIDNFFAQKKLHWYVSPQTFRVKDENSDVKVPWNGPLYAGETPNTFFVSPAKGQVLVVPKRLLDSQQDTFLRETIAANMRPVLDIAQEERNSSQIHKTS